MKVILKKLTIIFLLLMLTAFGLGCGADASTDDLKSDTYRGEFVDGDPQRRSYTFTGLSGYYEEILTVDYSKNLNLRLELAFGALQITVFNPMGNEVFFAVMKPGDAETRIIEGPMEAGTYLMILAGQKADGRILLSFEK